MRDHSYVILGDMEILFSLYASAYMGMTTEEAMIK
jgi:hypothetical protein